MLYRLFLLSAALLFTSLQPSLAQEGLPSGRLAFSSMSFGLVVGFNRGEGVLRLTNTNPKESVLPLEGSTYRFSVTGFSVATLGVTKVDAIGVVYNLTDIADFEGLYVAGEGGLTLLQGGGHIAMRNGNGVIIYLQLFNKGVELKLGGGGINIALEEQQPADDTLPEEEPAIDGHARSAEPRPTALSTWVIKP